jgi:dihydrofolate reductase
MPKYVVSSTLEAPEWSNSTLLEGDAATAISTLKSETEGEVVVFASFGLLPTLLDHNLVDELRLKVYPVVLGAGRRLFAEADAKKDLSLVDNQTIDGDVVCLTYRFTA